MLPNLVGQTFFFSCLQSWYRTLRLYQSFVRDVRENSQSLLLILEAVPFLSLQCERVPCLTIPHLGTDHPSFCFSIPHCATTPRRQSTDKPISYYATHVVENSFGHSRPVWSLAFALTWSNSTLGFGGWIIGPIVRKRHWSGFVSTTFWFHLSDRQAG